MCTCQGAPAQRSGTRRRANERHVVLDQSHEALAYIAWGGVAPQPRLHYQHPTDRQRTFLYRTLISSSVAVWCSCSTSKGFRLMKAYCGCRMRAATDDTHTHTQKGRQEGRRITIHARGTFGRATRRVVGGLQLARVRQYASGQENNGTKLPGAHTTHVCTLT